MARRRGIESKILFSVFLVGGCAVVAAAVVLGLVFNRWSGTPTDMALAVLASGCALGGLGFSLRAYHDIHHRIVQNLLLINEGANLVGKGDLDLSLDIATGDELETLAGSFNRMALDLKGKIDQLGASERRYRGLIDSMRDGIVQTDRAGRVTLMNPAGAVILGYAKPADVLGRDLSQVLHDPRAAERVIRALSEHGCLERSRIWSRRTDGTEVCLEMTANPVRTHDGRVEGFEGIFRDVAEGVRLERDARERAERLSATNQIANVINSSLHAGRLYESLVAELRRLVRFDFASVSLITDKEDAFEVRRVFPERDEFGEGAYPLRDQRWSTSIVAQSKQSLLVGNIDEAQEPLQDFPPAIKSCLCVPLFATGRIIGSMNLGAFAIKAFDAHDGEMLAQLAPHIAVALRNAQLLENLQHSLNEVTKAQERLHEANEELKTLDEMKTNLLSNVSHELRTPLVSVMGYTDMIYNERCGPITDQQRNYLGISLRNIDKLVTLIENLLDFSRLHRGAETIVFDTFDLVQCAQQSIEIVRPVAENREIVVALDAPDEPVLVEGDKGKLGQVFNNLLSNAVKFNHHGGRVDVEVRLTEDNVETIVSDTGIGIPQEALDKVFSRFYQYDSSSTRKYGGAGIGLSISQDIVRLHGGRMTVSSDEGQGATFRFSLPLRSLRRKAADRGDAPPVPETNLLVQLVTADRALCSQFRVLLDAEGVDLVVAGTAPNAIALAEKHHPDCIFVDLEAGPVSDTVLDQLLESEAAAQCPLAVYAGDEASYSAHAEAVVARIKPGFRKSGLLSTIHYTISAARTTGDALARRVLVVDDDPEIRDFIQVLLEAEGIEVEPCDSGEEALGKAAAGGYGLVLLDIAMPGMDGWETSRRIKALANGIKVYMVTAKPIESFDVRSSRSGADGYLLKPFKSNELVELVEGLLGAAPQTDASS